MIPGTEPDSATAQAEVSQADLDQARDQAEAGDSLYEHNTESAIDDDTNTEPTEIACELCGLSAFRMLKRIERGATFNCCARAKVAAAIGDIAYAAYRMNRLLQKLPVGDVQEGPDGRYFRRIDADHVVELMPAGEILDIEVDDSTIPF